MVPAGKERPFAARQDWPVMVCLLGGFRLIKYAQQVDMREAGKTGALLSLLALHPKSPTQRDTLLDVLWPAGDTVQAVQSLHSLVYSISKLLADVFCSERDYLGCLQYPQRILVDDPCREDAHRLVMRCYVRQGVRSLALRQYRLCETILRKEFDTVPEPATTHLFDQVRLDLTSV
jgi:DNA-binding SARP family transcriptional activator